VARGAAYKKYNDNKTGAGTFAKTKLIGIRGKIKKAKASQQWDEVDRLAEEGLTLNPWDTQLNADLGEAAQARGEDFLDVAKFAYTCARNADPKNKPLNYALANVLEARMEYDEAAKVCQHIAALDPDDSEARRRVTDLLTRKTTHEGKYDTANNTRDVAVKLNQLRPKEGDGDELTEEQALQRAIRKEPEKVEHHLKLGHFYRSNKRLEEAGKVLKKALEVSGGDLNIQEQIEDVELAQMRHNNLLAQEKATQNPDEEVYQNRARELDSELLKRELQVLSKRVERYPQDMNLKLEFAERLMRIKKWSQAIPLLQRASQHARLKGRALYQLGKCFLHDNKPQLARGQLERALPEIDANADPKMFCEGHYMMARICEQLGDPANAEKHYGEVLVIDYEYKDCRERLEKIQAGEA
jgi:tetratricopeptide (TPR) repeat protein